MVRTAGGAAGQLQWRGSRRCLAPGTRTWLSQAKTPVSTLPFTNLHALPRVPPACLNRYIDELVEKEVAGGIPASSIVVGGFSQGGAMALMSLRSKVRMVPWLLGAARGAAGAGHAVPILAAHAGPAYTLLPAL